MLAYGLALKCANARLRWYSVVDGDDDSLIVDCGWAKYSCVREA